MKYYKIVCRTPFCGEECEYFIKVFHDEELRRVIDECVYETGMEWYDNELLDVYDYTEDEYYAECSVKSIDEITEEEYLIANPWERE